MCSLKNDQNEEFEGIITFNIIIVIKCLFKFIFVRLTVIAVLQQIQWLSYDNCS